MLALCNQTLPSDAFEILLVDNASDPPVQISSSASNLRMVREPKQGLTHARLRGVSDSVSPVIVFVDDDNVLAPSYLQTALESFEQDSELGAIGGRIAPLWESEPPPVWMGEFMDLLALRDFGELPQRAKATEPLSYPAFAPVGAGMALRRTAINAWISSATLGDGPLDRTAGSLTSGGDNDIILHVLKSGWAIAYSPRLELSHIIPSSRLSSEYLGRLAESIMISWVATLERHGIRPWTPSSALTTWIRLARLLIVAKPWVSPSNYVRWKQRRGLILARARLRGGRSGSEGSF
jgi:glycosyltransferase involved in cell wall biosynthesis